MHIRKGQWQILVANGCMLAFFTVYYTRRANYEFLLYIGVIIFFLVTIIATNKKIEYPNGVLWGLTAWAFLHMSGGGFYIKGTMLYSLILIPISEKYQVFRFDQFVHIVGFAVATLVMYHVLSPLLKSDERRSTGLFIIVVMAGLGIGALNEIIEFIATVFLPETGVGGYVNTSLDLVADLIGAIIAGLYVVIRERR